MSPTITDPAKSLERAYEKMHELVERIGKYEAAGQFQLAAADRRSLRSTKAMISQLVVRLGGERPVFEPLPVTPRSAPPVHESTNYIVQAGNCPSLESLHEPGAQLVFDAGEWTVQVDGVEVYRSTFAYECGAYARNHGLRFPPYDPRQHEINVTGATQRRNT